MLERQSAIGEKPLGSALRIELQELAWHRRLAFALAPCGECTHRQAVLERHHRKIFVRLDRTLVRCDDPDLFAALFACAMAKTWRQIFAVPCATVTGHRESVPDAGLHHHV